MEGYKSFSISLAGAEHTKVGKVCQDAALHETSDLYEIAIVADGHGSEDYFRSHIGSRVATEVALEVIRQFASKISQFSDEELETFKTDPEQQGSLMGDAKKQIVELWRERIKQDHDENPFTEAEIDNVSLKYKLRYSNEKKIDWAYGTTLIAIAVTPKCWFALHIGDGNSIEEYCGDGKFAESVPADPACKGESTASLCQADALDHFRHYLSFEIPQMVFAHTDGIDDSFMADDVRNDVYLNMSASFVEQFDAAVERIKKILLNEAEHRKKDDTSMAGIVRLDGLTERAKKLYNMHLIAKRAIDYKIACSRRDELVPNCANLQNDIKKFEDRLLKLKIEQENLRAKEKEYKELLARLQSVNSEIQRVNSEIQRNERLAETNRKVLEVRSEELARCERTIKALENEVEADKAAAAKALEQSQKQVHDVPAAQEGGAEVTVAKSSEQSADSDESASAEAATGKPTDASGTDEAASAEATTPKPAEAEEHSESDQQSEAVAGDTADGETVESKVKSGEPSDDDQSSQDAPAVDEGNDSSQAPATESDTQGQGKKGFGNFLKGLLNNTP